MGRWEPDAAGRLRAAALELFVERGYEQTTVADVAARAGLTARTFFRHFSDKKEVLFRGSEGLQLAMVGALLAAPAEVPAMGAIAAALRAAAAYLGDMREFARRRREVIAAHPVLRERELGKLEDLSAALAAALRQRGIGQPDARLAAEAGMLVFRLAFEQWVAQGEQRSLDGIAQELLSRLGDVAGGR